MMDILCATISYFAAVLVPGEPSLSEGISIMVESSKLIDLLTLYWVWGISNEIDRYLILC